MQAFPPDFDVRVYRALNPDLEDLSDDGLETHYMEYGCDEGRIASEVITREDFIDLAPRDARVLEIGPFNNPMLRGPLVSYCDVLTTEQMRQLLVEEGLDPDDVPQIDYLIGPDGLDSIPDRFSAILSSHNLEHQIDLVRHLQQARRHLEDDGRYFLIVPDKRYTFDHFLAESNIAQVLEAYFTNRTTHTLQSIVEHIALTGPAESDRYWWGPEVPRPAVDPEQVQAAIELWNARRATLDVHAWYFTPVSFREIVTTLQALGLVGFELERLYPTLSDSINFFAILRATPEPAPE